MSFNATFGCWIDERNKTEWIVEMIVEYHSVVGITHTHTLKWHVISLDSNAINVFSMNEIYRLSVLSSTNQRLHQS